MPLILVLSLVFFNVFDTVSTLWILNNHLGTELNPLMRFAYGIGPWFFVVVKAATTSLSATAIYLNWHDPYVRVTGYGVTGIYACLFVYQVVSISWYLLGL